jgi:apolipoprotein N-acyltransferase
LGRLDALLLFLYFFLMTAKRRLWLLLLTLISAVLLPLALPNEFVGGAIRLLGLSPDESFFWGNAVIGLVCIAPVFFAVSLAPSFGFASLLGVVFGGVSTALTSFWLMFFQGFSVWTYGGTILGYVGYNALLFPFLRGFARIGGRFRPFLLAAAWCGYEFFKSIGFLGYPWGLIAYPMGSFLPIVQFVDVTGVWGLSFLMALVNAMVAECALVGWRPHFRRQAAFLVVLVTCVLIYGVVRLSQPIPQKADATLLLVQQNMDPWEGGSNVRKSLQVNLDLTAKGIASTPGKPDLAVWSESSVYDPMVENKIQFTPEKNLLVPGVQSMGVPVLFGGVVILNRKEQQYQNASILVSREGKVIDTYGKMHPVPFAESIPFFEVEWVKNFFRKVVGIWNPWTSGTRYTIYNVPLARGGGMSFGTPICFEDAFASVCRGFIIRGADVVMNITNDSWSNTWSSEIQHFQAARFRAIENRRVLVRSTNGGLSGVVGPWGEIRARMPFFESTYRVIDVPIYRADRLTPYSRFGDWFAWGIIALLLIVLVVDVLPKKKSLPLS